MNELNIIKNEDLISKNEDIIKQLSNLEMYKRIIDHMWESVWIWDEDERTIYANPNFCNIMEYSLEEMIWRESYDFRDPDSAKIVANNNEKRKEWESSKYEGVLRSKNGNLIPVLCSWTPIPWGWTVWIMTDLREIKDLENTKNELKIINKMKDEFISIVWHELKTPLSILNWHISMLLDGDMWYINSEAIESLKSMKSATKSLVQMVTDMLELSKIELWSISYYDDEISVIKIINFIYNDLKLVYKDRDIEFKLNILWDFTNDKILIDQTRLRQVIVNLVNNAFKFTHDNGSININIIDKNEYIEFQIQDTWIGIPENQLEKIFSKFHQIESSLSRKNEWLWLWLSIISWIIHHYNSEINVKSKINEWSIFSFQLEKIK